MSVDVAIAGRWRLVSSPSAGGYDILHLEEVTKGKNAGKLRWKTVGRNLRLPHALERIIQEAPHDHPVDDLKELSGVLLRVKAEIATFLTFPNIPSV